MQLFICAWNSWDKRRIFLHGLPQIHNHQIKIKFAWVWICENVIRVELAKKKLLKVVFRLNLLKSYLLQKTFSDIFQCFIKSIIYRLRPIYNHHLQRNAINNDRSSGKCVKFNQNYLEINWTLRRSLIQILFSLFPV